MARPRRAARVPVVAEITNNHRALLQVYTGLDLLHRAGVIDLRDEVSREPVRGLAATTRLRVGDAAVGIDVRDGPAIHEQVATHVDVYAKRSHRLEGYDDVGTTVVPLGLNYAVYPSGVDLRILRRMRLPGSGGRAPSIARALAVDRITRLPKTPRTSTIRPSRATTAADGPHVVFLTRTWDFDPNGNPVRAAIRTALNERRVACIRALRRELGPRFVGGIDDHPFAREHYPDCVVDDAQTSKLRYLRTVGSTAIGVTTTGLEGSVGWKLGEYVAMGRAIVTEPLLSVVPGTFRDGVHYRSFATVDECVEACSALLDDEDAVEEMSQANAAYYDLHLRPDRLVAHVLGHVAPAVLVGAGLEPSTA